MKSVIYSVQLLWLIGLFVNIHAHEGKTQHLPVSPELYLGAILVEHHYSAGFGGTLAGGIRLNNRHYFGVDIAIARNIEAENAFPDVNTLFGMKASYYFAPVFINDLFTFETGFAVAYGSDEYENYHGSWGIPARISLGNGKLFGYVDGCASMATLSDLMGDFYNKSPYLASVTTGIKYNFGRVETSDRALLREKQLQRRKIRDSREIITRKRALYVRTGATASLAIFKSTLPKIENTIPFRGFELDLGTRWHSRHLMYANFTASYSEQADTFRGGVGYSYSLSENRRTTVRIGGILGLWFLNSYYGSSDTNFQYEYQRVPYFGGPTIHVEWGTGAPRFFISNRLLIGAGIFNTISTGIAFDFSKRAIHKAK